MKSNPKGNRVFLEGPPLNLTVHAGIVHQDDLLEENGRGGVEDTVNCPQQSAPTLIVKHNYHTGGRQGGASLEGLLNTSAVRRKKEHNDLTVHTVPEWHNGLVITSADSPLWGVHFSCDTACVAAFEIPAILKQERLCNSPPNKIASTWTGFMSVSRTDMYLDLNVLGCTVISQT